jgi:hypothetical protein
LDENSAGAEVADLLYAFEPSYNNIKMKLDPRSQPFLFLRFSALEASSDFRVPHGHSAITQGRTDPYFKRKNRARARDAAVK